MTTPIRKPVKVDSSTDAFFIVDAGGTVIADNIHRKEWADEIAARLNGDK